MNRDDYHLAVAAMNGRPQRLATVSRAGGPVFRDQVNADSSLARHAYIARAAAKFAVDREELAWLDDALVSAADEADIDADLAAGEANQEVRKNQSSSLIELCAGVELFRDPEGKGYARFRVAEHYEVTAVRSRHFRNWLAHQFYLVAAKAPSSQAMQDALGVLEGKAVFEGETRPVAVRVAEHLGHVYVDLCNAAWQVVEVTASGWRVLDESPVMFRRAKAMLPLPSPTRGGSVNELRRFVHMADEDWTLFKAWLVAALRPVGPYPVLDLQGEHGSGKSTACRMARALIDPNTALLRCEPREPRDLMIAANNGWVIALDNLSGIQAWQSDCLCRLATGGGFSTRTLYENDEETIFDAQRPVVINGIDDVATRADLLDRCVLLNLPRMSAVQRQTEAVLWRDFEAARPRIFGALLSAVAAALQNHASVELPVLPRMADFAIWATAAAPALEQGPNDFHIAYQANRSAGNEVALEASPVGKALLAFIQAVREWSGTATELLEQLDRLATDRTRRLSAWPTTARQLGGLVQRLAPNLRAAGVAVDFRRTGKFRTRTIELRGEPESAVISSSALSAASAGEETPAFAADSVDQAAAGQANAMDGADAIADRADVAPGGSASAMNAPIPEEFSMADKADGADAELPQRSESLAAHIW